MSWLHRARNAVADLFGRERFEREMDEELQTFLDLSAQDRERAGAAPSEAHRTARASFGGFAGCKDTLRDLRTGAALDSVARDARVAVRGLRRNPSFAAAAILTIALGTFPIAAALGFANRVFLLPPPGVAGGEQLVAVEFITQDETGDRNSTPLSYLNLADVMRGVKSLSGLAGRSEGSLAVAVPGVDALRVDVDYVMHDYFRVLGMRLAAGRGFLASDDREPGGAPVAIAGHALAARLFGAPEAAPGRSLLINGLDFTVVGVVPPGFRGLRNDHYSQLWLPGAAFWYASHTPRERWAQGRTGGLFERFVGRLAPGVGIEQARTELTVAVRAAAAAHPAENRHLRTAGVQIERQPGMSFSGGNTRNRVAFMVLTFTSTGALLLLLAAANVGNLWLFRAARRRGETALRSALGASRWRLLRAHLIEVAILSLLGGGAGLVLTAGFAKLVDGFIVPDAGFLSLPIDWRAAGLVLGAAMLVGLLFGGAPMVFGPASGFTLAVRRIGGDRRRLRNALTVMQLAISLSLLVAAGLLLATIRNLAGVDVGFDPARVVSARVIPHDNGYDDRRSLAYYRSLLDRAAALPAIEAVSVSGGAPFVGGMSRRDVRLPAAAGRSASMAVAVNGVSADYFRVLGLALRRGRAFSPEEAFAVPDGSCGPIVLSESLAVRLFGTRDAVHRRAMLAGRVPLECQVVGVVADVRVNRLDADVMPVVYRPLGRSLGYGATVLARASVTMSAASDALREAGAAIDPALPFSGQPSLATAIEFQIAGRRIISSVLGGLAAMGLLMAAVGLSGLVAETVVDRKREFAVRLALGAGARRVLLAVLRRAVVLAALGTAAGLALSLVLAGAIRNQLFGVMALEPSVYLSAAAALAVVVLLASLAPAVRAARTNPADVLRAE
jgi:predicted permease